MKSNLFFFVLCFFSPLFELGKNENTWSCQAKFVEVDPTQKTIFLSAYSSRFKWLMKKNNIKNVFRLFGVQACKATNHNQTSHNFLSIFLCVHGKYFIRYARSELRVFHVNLFTLSVTVTFFSATCKFSHCRCQRRLVIYQTWQGFHSRNLTKFFVERHYCHS